MGGSQSTAGGAMPDPASPLPAGALPLPADVLDNLLERLSARDRLRVACASKGLHSHVAGSPGLWRRLDLHRLRREPDPAGGCPWTLDVPGRLFTVCRLLERRGGAVASLRLQVGAEERKTLGRGLARLCASLPALTDLDLGFVKTRGLSLKGLAQLRPSLTLLKLCDSLVTAIPQGHAPPRGGPANCLTVLRTLAGLRHLELEWNFDVLQNPPHLLKEQLAEPLEALTGLTLLSVKDSSGFRHNFRHDEGDPVRAGPFSPRFLRLTGLVALCMVPPMGFPPDLSGLGGLTRLELHNFQWGLHAPSLLSLGTLRDLTISGFSLVYVEGLHALLPAFERMLAGVTRLSWHTRSYDLLRPGQLALPGLRALDSLWLFEDLAWSGACQLTRLAIEVWLLSVDMDLGKVACLTTLRELELYYRYYEPERPLPLPGAPCIGGLTALRLRNCGYASLPAQELAPATRLRELDMTCKAVVLTEACVDLVMSLTALTSLSLQSTAGAWSHASQERAVHLIDLLCKAGRVMMIGGHLPVFASRGVCPCCAKEAAEAAAAAAAADEGGDDEE